ncbi:MAG: beta-ketoacyl synthase N-terminal-like domain-containing protein, partial [Desulfuromonadaceae bacterium]
LVSPLGIDKEEFVQGLSRGGRPAGPPSSFSTDTTTCKTCFEVPAFDAVKYLRVKIKKILDRCSKMGLMAAQQAFDDAGLDEGQIANTGIVISTALGSMTNTSLFDRQRITEGPDNVSPMQFPTTILNSHAANINIHFGIPQTCITFSSIQTGSLDAIAYATQLIQAGRLETVLAGGMEELSESCFLALDRLNLLASNGISAPFYKQSTGVLLGEGAGVLLLEERDHAVARGATILAEIKGSGMAFGVDPINPAKNAFKSAILNAARQANVGFGDMDAIYSGATGNKQQDGFEFNTLKGIFNLEEVPVTSIKKHTGECLGASGAFAVASATLSLTGQLFPSFHDPMDDDPNNYLVPMVKDNKIKAIRNCLVCSSCVSGAGSAIVMSRHDKGTI